MQQYPHGYGYPYGQPVPDPTIPMLVQQLQQMQQLLVVATKKNEQECTLEEAYSEVIQSSNMLWVPDKRGNMRVLLDVGFDHVYYIKHDKLYGKEDFYAIAIHNIPDYVTISVKEFYKPSMIHIYPTAT